jgi:DNA-binding transcriptional ArsR family regulator
MGRAAKSFDLARMFAAFSDRTRLRLLNLMNGREVCVCYFVEILGQSQPKISRHLAYLRNAGLVKARRDGKWMHYRLETPADAGAAAILRTTLESLGRIGRCRRIWCGWGRLVAHRSDSSLCRGLRLRGRTWAWVEDGGLCEVPETIGNVEDVRRTKNLPQGLKPI